ncbi:hypothetical protein F9K33_07910 [bacterium]|nr:MAG: hypothetical protein F9K33_07910 [bacterium]
MTDQEKINRHDALIFLRERMGGCFGSADGIFAGHPMDEKRAKELRQYAAENNISLQEIKEIALNYLYSKSYISEHIEEQLPKVIKYFGKKLS